MRVVVNGAEHELAPGTSIADLVRTLGLTSARVAVERNGRLVPRPEHERTELADGDRLEIVTLVGGG